VDVPRYHGTSGSLTPGGRLGASALVSPEESEQKHGRRQAEEDRRRLVLLARQAGSAGTA
jgi:hypothetical protein